VNCSDCGAPHTKKMCDACRRMQLESRWDWEIDNGNRICRCPECGSGNVVGAYAYNLQFRYCTWCGEKMVTGEQLRIDGF